MKALSELTLKIREWNMMGYSLLPTLQIAIIHSNVYNRQIISFLEAFQVRQLFYIEKYQTEKDTRMLQKADIQKQITQKIHQEQTTNEKTQKQNSQDQKLKASSQKDLYPEQNQKEQVKVQKINYLENWDSRLQDGLYAIYMLKGQIECRIHIVIDRQENGKINDQDLKQSKKLVQKLKRNKNLIFVNFNNSLFNLDSMSQHIEQFGLNFKSKEREIVYQSVFGNRIKKQFLSAQQNQKNKIVNKFVENATNFNNKQSNFFQKQCNETLCKIIQQKYRSVYAMDLNRNFTQMKNMSKQLKYTLRRYQGLIEIIKFQQSNRSEQNQQAKTRNLTSYALKCLYQTNQHLSSSLMGTFSFVQTINVSAVNRSLLKGKKSKPLQRRSLHWEIMQLMNQLWDIQGDTLLKEVDKMPLSYIQQRYKMLDYQSIGGFMPSSCFQAIFSPPLRNTVYQITQTLKAVEFKILKQVELSYQHFFDKLNIVDEIVEKQYESIRQVCQKFREQISRTLNSQIEYISTSAQDFWSYKQLKTSIYKPQMQVYIEIKYIGKAYIKKVFDNIKQTVPRMIGQNFLKEICLKLQSHSLNNLIEVTKHTAIEIEMSKRDIQALYNVRDTYAKIDRMIYYFSLKTNSTTAIKNYHERSEKNWNRMFRNQNRTVMKEKQNDEYQHNPEQKGFLKWARKLFIRRPPRKRQTEKRSVSQSKYDRSQKIRNVQKGDQQIERNRKKQHFLSQKNWLLIINIDKNVQMSKIQHSAKDGFPEKLRPAIWFYIARKQRSEKLKVSQVLSRKQSFSQQQQEQIDQIYNQIQKDVRRTPPSNLFATGLLKQSLTNVLRSYAILDKQLRYTQGMNFISGIILCVLTHHMESQTSQYIDSAQKNTGFYYQDIEDKALRILLLLMHQKGLRKIMLLERDTINDMCIRLQNYIQEKSPIMHQKIQNSGFNVEMIFSGALISGLTTAEINFGVQRRVLDILITIGFNSLYKIIGQFTAAAESLCQKTQAENLYYFLKGNLYDAVYAQIGDQGLTKLFHSI